MARTATPQETAKAREMLRNGATPEEIARNLHQEQQKADQPKGAPSQKATPAASRVKAAPRKGKPPAPARLARQAGSRFTSSAKSSAFAPLATAGSVLGAFVVAFASVLVLSILVLPRSGGGSGAGALGTLLGVVDQAISGFSSSSPFFKEVSS